MTHQQTLTYSAFKSTHPAHNTYRLFVISIQFVLQASIGTSNNRTQSHKKTFFSGCRCLLFSVGHKIFKLHFSFCDYKGEQDFLEHTQSAFCVAFIQWIIDKKYMDNTLISLLILWCFFFSTFKGTFSICRQNNSNEWATDTQSVVIKHSLSVWVCLSVCVWNL